MRICPDCNIPYPDSATTCERDGARLITTKTAFEKTGAYTQIQALGDVVGHYRLNKKLSKGGMGTVYQATHISIGKEFAVKVLKEDHLKQPQLLELFYQEARACAQLVHENIVQIVDFGCTPTGHAYLVMELLSGRTLESLLREEKRLPASRAIHIALQICAGMSAAHKQGIIHRDLKPENTFLTILRNDPDFVKVIDFGIAKQTQDQNRHVTVEKHLAGTPEYMAPEQGLDIAQKVDARTDVYALGVILFRMVTGQTPFAGTNGMDILCRHYTEPPPNPAELANIPAGLTQVILKALQKKKDDRFASMEEIAQALESILELAPLTTLSKLRPSQLPPELQLEEPARDTLLSPRDTFVELPASADAHGDSLTPQPTTTPHAPPKRRSFGWVALFALLLLGAGGAVFYLLSTQKTAKPTPQEAAQGVLLAAPSASLPLVPTSTPMSAPTSIAASTPASTSAPVEIAASQPVDKVAQPKPKNTKPKDESKTKEKPPKEEKPPEEKGILDKGNPDLGLD